MTHPDVRRYFMTVSEAVALVLRAAYGDHSELYVLDMGEQIRIADLARQMITMMGLVPDVDIPIEFTGLRPGEKLSEELMTEDEERTRRVNLKIFATECPAPPEDLEEALSRLAARRRARTRFASCRSSSASFRATVPRRPGASAVRPGGSSGRSMRTRPGAAVPVLLRLSRPAARQPGQRGPGERVVGRGLEGVEVLLDGLLPQTEPL